MGSAITDEGWGRATFCWIGVNSAKWRNTNISGAQRPPSPDNKTRRTLVSRAVYKCSLRARSFLFIAGSGPTALHCAHRTSTASSCAFCEQEGWSGGSLSHPSKLTCFTFFGRAPMLVYVRPSNEALLRARVPGAQDQRAWPSTPFHRAHSASTESVHVALLPSLLISLLRCFGLSVHVFLDPENPRDRPEPTQNKRRKRPAPG